MVFRSRYLLSDPWSASCICTSQARNLTSPCSSCWNSQPIGKQAYPTTTTEARMVARAHFHAWCAPLHTPCVPNLVTQLFSAVYTQSHLIATHGRPASWRSAHRQCPASTRGGPGAWHRYSAHLACNSGNDRAQHLHPHLRPIPHTIAYVLLHVALLTQHIPRAPRPPLVPRGSTLGERGWASTSARGSAPWGRCLEKGGWD